jgi:hypothetical protein
MHPCKYTLMSSNVAVVVARGCTYAFCEAAAAEYVLIEPEMEAVTLCALLLQISWVAMQIVSHLYVELLLCRQQSCVVPVRFDVMCNIMWLVSSHRAAGTPWNWWRPMEKPWTNGATAEAYTCQ